MTPDAHLLSQIDRHLRKENWLLNEDLITELTDHYVAAIEVDMQQGLTIEQAIQKTHADFGGRKGLLATEEDYQKSQAKQFSRQIKERFVSYFHLPRLGVTGLFFFVSYGLVRLWPVLIATSFWENSWALVALGGMGLAYVIAFVQLTNGVHRRWTKNARGQLVWVLIQTMNIAIVSGGAVNIFLPLDQLVSHHPVLTSLVVTLLLMLEAATSELLFERITKNRNHQPA